MKFLTSVETGFLLNDNHYQLATVLKGKTMLEGYGGQAICLFVRDCLSAEAVAQAGFSSLWLDRNDEKDPSNWSAFPNACLLQI